MSKLSERHIQEKHRIPESDAQTKKLLEDTWIRLKDCLIAYKNTYVDIQQKQASLDHWIKEMEAAVEKLRS